MQAPGTVVNNRTVSCIEVMLSTNFTQRNGLQEGLNSQRNGLKAKNTVFDNTKLQKRVALGTITNVQRKPLDRACKTKTNANIHASFQPRVQSRKEGFSIYVEPKAPCSTDVEIHEEILNLHSSVLNEVDSPMSVSPFIEKNVDPIKRDVDVRRSKEEWVEYEDDILIYLKKLSEKNSPRVGYMNKQPDINHNMRAILVDWLVEVCEEYLMQNRTLHLAVSYIDRFLSLMSVQRGKLQLVGTACLFIAAKYEEVYPPDASDFIYVTDDAYTQEQLLRMEQLILKALGYNVSVPVILDFLDTFLVAAGCETDDKSDDDDKKLRFLAMFLCELTLLDSRTFLKYPPASIAASAILLAAHTLASPISKSALLKKCSTNTMEVLECMNDLQDAFMDAPTLKYQVAIQKYSKDIHFQVAKISPVVRPINYI